MNRILIVDDHPLVAKSLADIVSKSDLGEVVRTASTARECLDCVATLGVNLVLLDINLPDASGLDVCKTITQQHPEVKVLALTSHNEYSIIRKMLENGASGYVLKNSMPEEIEEGIECVLNGGIFLSHNVNLLLKRGQNQQVILTPREAELLRLICEGYTNAEIAEMLFLGLETINSYRKNLLVKLNAKNTAMLVRIAIEGKLV